MFGIKNIILMIYTYVILSKASNYIVLIFFPSYEGVPWNETMRYGFAFKSSPQIINIIIILLDFCLPKIKG